MGNSLPTRFTKADFQLSNRRGYVQDERYIAIEHKDVRRDCVSFARRNMNVRRDCVSFARRNMNVRRDCVSFAQCLSFTNFEYKLARFIARSDSRSVPECNPSALSGGGAGAGYYLPQLQP